MSLLAPELDYPLADFAAGFLSSPEPNQLPKGATPAAANSFFFGLNASAPMNEYGVGQRPGCKMGRRHGARLVNPSAMTAGSRVDGLYEFIREGVTTGLLLSVCNGSLYQWDAANAFTLVSAAGFTAGAALEFMTFRNLAFVMDGTLNKIYDGTSVFDVGQIAPTAAPALAAVAPAAAGVTGTYQTLGVWYDSTHDHESSPSSYSAATVFAAQDRQHTIPAGAPASNYDKWRIYCRRTDTNELYFKLVAETVVGTATATEAVTDTTRNLASTLLAPLPNQNDVPPAFAFMATAQGYAFGVVANDSYVHISANGDPQSFHPKDVIGIARGDGRNVTTCKAVPAGESTVIIVQKARKSYQLKGDRMPFIPDELSPSFGNHSQASSVSAAGRYWCWDDEKGPYWTDMSTRWVSLSDGIISPTVQRVNKNAEIRCCHVKSEALICWLVATETSTRTRMLLAYNYLVGAWLPPMNGIEYGSLTTFQLADGTVQVFIGDQWGRVYKYFLDEKEGPPSGTLTAAVTSATPSTVTAAAAAFYTTGDGLQGMPCAVVDAHDNWQFRIIASNTATTLTLDTTHGAAWTVQPDATYTVVVGPIDWYWRTPLIDFGKPMMKKLGGFVYGQFRTTGASVSVVVRSRLDDAAAAATVSETFSVGTDTWGAGQWGVMVWGAVSTRYARQRFTRSYYGVQFEISNRYPNQWVEVVTFGTSADPLLVWAHNAP